MKKIILLITVALIAVACNRKNKTIISKNEVETPKKQMKFVADTLRIYTGLGKELLSMSHNIDGFFIPSTKNTFPNSEKNVNNMQYKELDGLLTLTALAYIDGEPVGVANETELIYDFSKKSDANTMWLLKMNKKGYKGFIALEQIENPANADPELQKMYQEELAKGKKKDIDILFRTTSKEGAIVAHASGDFTKYKGGKFTEYSIVNPSDPTRNRILLEFITVDKR